METSPRTRGSLLQESASVPIVLVQPKQKKKRAIVHTPNLEWKFDTLWPSRKVSVVGDRTDHLSALMSLLATHWRLLTRPTPTPWSSLYESLRSLLPSAFTPSTTLPTPTLPISTHNNNISPTTTTTTTTTASLLDALLLAAPKKRTSHTKKRLRMKNKYIKRIGSMATCEICGRYMAPHTYCKNSCQWRPENRTKELQEM